MHTTIESCATPDGKMVCELLSDFYYGSNVYSVHIYKANDDFEYEEITRSYPTGSIRKANTTYKQYRNQYLRNRKH